MRDGSSRQLDSVEKQAPGSGKLDLGILGDLVGETDFLVGGYVDYQHRITDSISTYARAEAGRVLGAGHNFASAGAGIRVRF